MTVTYDQSLRTPNSAPLEDRFEVLKQIGDGSFGSVAVARVRTAGSHVARRGTMVAIKTMKKTFDSFSACLELREVIFLRTLPHHPHLVPALDIFRDPLSNKLHICMEYMDGNLYQLMKARDHKCFDAKSVKSILFQILSGLDHIHAHHFFHRDIKPENILVSGSMHFDSVITRYATPPSTPPSYTVKIADFGLARETHSKLPYTTYVSTRWYRAPEVLLRAGEYSAPVDMWAIGAMAVEIATLKPLFPGANEVDQVWRVCEIMGSPGNWYSKSGAKVGGGEWKEGIRLAQKLGFSFPKMAPHSLESILQPPNWPASLSQFVTWCLMWDPKSRPTSTQALNHEYFADAVDPLRPKSSTARILGRKQSDKSFRSASNGDSPGLTSKPSWFRRSLIGRSDSPAPVYEQLDVAKQSLYNGSAESPANKTSKASKRATWANGAPMPILPSIRPVSPLSNTVHAQANSSIVNDTPSKVNGKSLSKKIGRQLSVNSHGNHYPDAHRAEAERALNGGSSVTSPTAVKEGFFSHLRKRARRLSGRNQISIPSDDVEATAGCVPWSNRSSMALDSVNLSPAKPNNDLRDLDAALQSVRYSNDMSSPPNVPVHNHGGTSNTPRRQSVPHPQALRVTENGTLANGGSVSVRARRALQNSTRSVPRYETPEEEDELLHEVLHSANCAAQRLHQNSMIIDDSARNSLFHDLDTHPNLAADNSRRNPYPTPSPTARRDKPAFISDITPSKPLGMNKPDMNSHRQWPTPPYDEAEWATATAADVFAAGNMYR